MDITTIEIKLDKVDLDFSKETMAQLGSGLYYIERTHTYTKTSYGVGEKETVVDKIITPMQVFKTINSYVGILGNNVASNNLGKDNRITGIARITIPPVEEDVRGDGNNT